MTSRILLLLSLFGRLGCVKEEADIQTEINAAIDQALSAEEKWLLENGKSNAGYHYLGSAKFFAQLGEAFAKALHTMEK